MSNFVLMHDMEQIERHLTSRTVLIDYLLMEMILQCGGTVGSWTLKNELDKLGIDVATATIGRNLKVLDHKGYTEQVSNKGRRLTREGVQETLRLRGTIQRSVLSDNIVNSVEITHIQDLVEVLSTRLIIEREAAYLAAQNATPKDIALMDLALEQHRTLLSEEWDDSQAGLDFHDILVKAAKNKFMSAVSRLLAFEEHQIETRYPYLSTRAHAKEYIHEHEALRNAIADHDGERAADLMERHLRQIIDVVKSDKNKF